MEFNDSSVVICGLDEFPLGRVCFCPLFIEGNISCTLPFNFSGNVKGSRTPSTFNSAGSTFVVAADPLADYEDRHCEDDTYAEYSQDNYKEL